MSKLEFNIVEIPEGESEKSLVLEPEDLDLSPYKFKGGQINITFYRALHFIRVNFTVHSEIELECDRSLDLFDYPVDADYEIVFKVDVEEETEDENGAVRRFNFSSNSFSIADEVRDTIILQVPMQKVHPRYLNEDGTPKEFETKAFGKAEEDYENEEKIDPRWEDLKKLKN